MEKKDESQVEQMKNMSRKVLFSIIIGVIGIVLTIILTQFALQKSAEAKKAYICVSEYRLASKGLTYNVQNYAVTADGQYKDAYMREIETDKKREKAIEDLKKLDVSDKEWEIIDQIAALSNGLVTLEEEAFESAQAKDLKKAQDKVFGKEYEDAVQKINELTETFITEMTDRIQNKVIILRVLTIGLQILLLLAVFLITNQTKRALDFAKNKMLYPILKVEDQMKELAKGNLHAEIDLEVNGSEVGQMAAAIYRMKDILSRMITEISSTLEQMAEGKLNVELHEEYVGEFIVIERSMREIMRNTRDSMEAIHVAADQLNEGSDQLSTAAISLAESGTTQATVVDELFQAIKDMTASIQNSTDEALETARLASTASETMAEGNKKLDQLKSSIREIEHRSQEIGGIIESINAIASQTNLLALNAAIEAARAGEAGKGFAVVAEQVKELAGESAKAANETTLLIEASIEAVNLGTQMADETAESMEEVMKETGLATEKIKEIAGMLEAEDIQFHDIQEGINKVASLAENNSAVSQQTAAVSAQQKSQVETMVSLVDHFQIS